MCAHNLAPISEHTKGSPSLISMSTPDTEGLRHFPHTSHCAHPKPDHWQMFRSCCEMFHFSGLPMSLGAPSSSKASLRLPFLLPLPAPSAALALASALPTMPPPRRLAGLQLAMEAESADAPAFRRWLGEERGLFEGLLLLLPKLHFLGLTGPSRGEWK